MTTYMEIVNKVIKRINEVEVDETTFSDVIGVQATVKDAVIDTLDRIIQKKWKWPFLATDTSVVLTPGDQEYPWPEDFLSVDWNSFQMQKDTNLNVAARHLDVIEREEWYRLFRDDDKNSLPLGLRQPVYVFSNHGKGWGITPCPDKAYTINYRYFMNPARPSEWDDELIIPKEYEYLIVHGALAHMYTFLDNNERATIQQQMFDDGLDDMVKTLIGNNFEHAYSGMIIHS